MNRRFRNDLKGSMIVPVGWLFADLLLAVAMLFLVANTVGAKHMPTPTPTLHPTPTPTHIPTPTPTPVLRIVEGTYCQIVLKVDSGGLLNNSSNAIADIKSQIKKSSFLQGRQAGLVIVYGGAPTLGDTSTAQEIARHIYQILGMLGKQNFVFVGTSYFDPLFVIGNDSSIVSIDIYLLVRQSQPNETCNSNHQPL